MPVFQREQLLNELADDVRYGIAQTQQLAQLSAPMLIQPAPESGWSPAQHLHHLNFYAAFYTQSLEHSIDHAKVATAASSFRSGWLGNYFTRIIGPAPDQGQLAMKMKSPANAVPPASSELDSSEQIAIYLGHQKRLLYLLQRAQQLDLGRNRAAISLSPWIRLKLGDTFRFVIAHQQRHFQVLAPLLDKR